jgi:hypothetical protein
MRRKVFWITFSVLGLIASFSLPLMWSIIATVPILIFACWFAYRNHLFDD